MFCRCSTARAGLQDRLVCQTTIRHDGGCLPQPSHGKTVLPWSTGERKFPLPEEARNLKANKNRLLFQPRFHYSARNWLDGSNFAINSAGILSPCACVFFSYWYHWDRLPRNVRWISSAQLFL
ncbi:hypothetical protein PSPO01_12129 [Paraphaeosphaeria sporulosa]